MFESGRVALPDVREWSGNPPECLVGPLGYPGVVGRPSRMSGSYRESLTNVREWVGGPPGCLGVFVRSSRMSKSGREALLDVRQL